MTIADEITKLQNNLSDSYTACQNKGATIPVNQNFDNLPDTIDSITGGSGNGIVEQIIEDVIDGNNPVDTTDLQQAEEDVAGIIPYDISTTKTITENGTYNAVDDNANGYSSVTVNVPSPVISPLSVTPSTTSQTITAPSGTDGYSPISVSAITSDIDSNITAENIKKDVSILGVTGTYEGTTPTLKTKTITQNGTYNASSDNADGYSQVAVNVPTITPSGALSITQNGTFDVTNYASANVSVSGGGSDWQPDPDWWDIESILKADTRDYAGKAIILYSNANNFTDITISSPCVAVATSDGMFYTSTTTHTWDRAKDKIVSDDEEDITPKFGTRYLILYFNTTNVVYTALTDFRLTSIYAIFNCNLTKNSSDIISTDTFFHFNVSLQFFKFLGNYNFIFGKDFSYFCANCYSLVQLPDNLDTSNVESFYGFCQSAKSLTKLPNSLDTSRGKSFTYFCSQASALKKLPDNLDTSRGTNFTNFCSYCNSLVQLPDTLDISNSTSLNSFCISNNSLIKANIKLTNVSTNLSFASLISIQSLEYIADNAPTVTGTVVLTIGSTNITRVGGSSSTIVQTLTNKGWTVR